MSLKKDLLAALDQWGVGTPETLSSDTSLLQSGLLDSVALFELSLWVEAQVGHPVDPAAVDLLQEWDTVGSIVRFIERSTGRDAHSTAAPKIVPISPTPKTARAAGSLDYEIVPYKPDLKSVVIDLQKRLWSSDAQLNLRYFEWKYEHNPFADEPLIYLARQGDRYVAMRGFCPSNWEAGTNANRQRFSWDCSDDLVVESSHEGHGLFARFTDLAVRDVAARGHGWYLSLSALRVTRLQSLTSGSRSLGVMNPVGRFTTMAALSDRIQESVRKIPLAWRALKRLKLGGDARAAFHRLDHHPNTTLDGITLIASPAARVEEMAKLIDVLPFDGRLRHVRDARYLAWRFDNPLHEYRFLYVYSEAKLVGYLVLERGVSDYANARRINIADWEFHDNKAGRALLASAISMGDPPELVAWTATLDPTRTMLLQAAGLTATDTEQTQRGLPCILVRGVGEQGALPDSVKALADLDNWDFRMIYTNVA